MNLQNSTILITGANRGIGAALVHAALDAGARRVYATSRSGLTPVDDDRVVGLALDVTDPASVAAAAETATDVSLLVNNAGVAARQGLLTGDLDQMRLEMETNFWGPLLLTRAFAPALARAGGGAVVTVASVLAMTSFEGAGSYAASKAAAWSANDGLRLELAGQGTQVVTAFLASTDTDMMSGWDVFKNDPADVATAILTAVREGADEVFVDDDSRTTKENLASPVAIRYPDLAAARAR